MRNSSSQDQWHLLYYVLAAFDLVTILASLLLNHTLLEIHSASISLNEQWAQRSVRYEELASVLSQVNAPGNDVFDSKDVKGESARLDRELQGFRRIMGELEKESDAVPDPSQRREIQEDLRGLNSAMNDMVAEANLIFSHFRHGDEAKAGSRMATMDRKYAALNQRMSKARTRLHRFQSHDLAEQRNKAHALGRFEYGLAGLVLLMICFVTFYGHETSRRVRHARKLIETQQAQIQTAAKMSALGEMAGGIAHEINNPLAIIQLRAAQLKEMGDAGETDGALIAEIAKEIEKTSIRMAKIVKGLRTFARDGSSDPYYPEALSTILEDTLALCQEKVRSRGINLEVTACPEVYIDCRATEISQVLLNLVGNAVDAISNGGQTWIRVAVSDRADYVEISVTDGGPGIPAEIRDKIMQPFFTTKEVGKGTGLGLSISRGIAESHRGKLDLDPLSSHTRFVFSLPKRQPVVVSG